MSTRSGPALTLAGRSQERRPARSQSVARAQQHGSTPEDDQLTLRARAERPRVQHWWGRRRWWVPDDPADPSQFAVPNGAGQLMVSRNGAWCYLCDSPIAAWSSRWPMTEQARAQIALHRQSHLQLELDPSATGVTR